MNNETPKDNEFQANQNNQQPVNPEVQEVPPMPEVPVTPAAQEVPIIPAAPVTPEEYVTPKEPEAPKKRAKRKKGPAFYLIIVAIVAQPTEETCWQSFSPILTAISDMLQPILQKTKCHPSKISLPKQWTLQKKALPLKWRQSFPSATMRRT